MRGRLEGARNVNHHSVRRHHSACVELPHNPVVHIVRVGLHGIEVAKNTQPHVCIYPPHRDLPLAEPHPKADAAQFADLVHAEEDACGPLAVDAVIDAAVRPPCICIRVHGVGARRGARIRDASKRGAVAHGRAGGQCLA
eukprot:127616-Rhodomonas_salina.3